MCRQAGTKGRLAEKLGCRTVVKLDWLITRGNRSAELEDADIVQPNLICCRVLGMTRSLGNRRPDAIAC